MPPPSPDRWRARRAHTPSIARTAGPGVVAFLAAIVLPFGAYVLLGSISTAGLGAVSYVIAAAYVVSITLLVVETRAAFSRRSAPRPPHAPVPSDGVTSIIVSAYLPNEQGLILETLLHLATQLDTATSRLQVIVAYNTDRALPVEADLRRFAELCLHVDCVRVPGSSSKAENIMYALQFVRGDLTVLLDADHHLEHDAIERARRWLDLGYDVVQGRCVVRNQKETWLTRIVAVEFEQMYAVGHTGRSLLFDTAIFGGTNGYWRTDVLRRVGMDREMLTEDIDATLRATLAGSRIVHDRSVISSELATAHLSQWWKQRMRWAQGWFQVTLRHQRAVWDSEVLAPGLRIYWTMLLTWRECFPLISVQIPGVILASAILGRRLHLFGDPLLTATTILTFGSGLWVAYTCERVALWRTRENLRSTFVAFAFFAWPYTILKNVVVLVAIAREVLGDRHWVVTHRSGHKPSGQAPAQAP